MTTKSPLTTATVRVAVPVDHLADYDSVDDYVQSAVNLDELLTNSEELKAEYGLTSGGSSADE